MKFFFEKFSFLRVYTWWTYKLPPLFGIAYFFTLTGELEFADAVKRFAIFIPCMIGTAGFGHYLNDLFDIEADRLAGKTNASSRHSMAQRILIIATLLALSLAPWFIFYKFGLLHILVIAVLLLFVFYSAPPFRLKDRGLLGVLADTLYAHGIPSLVIALAMLNGMPEKTDERLPVMAVFAWQFMVGFRNIVFHQIEDLSNDQVAKVSTWAARTGIQRLKKISLYFIHPLEIIFYLLIAAALFRSGLAWGLLLTALIAWRVFIYLFIYEKGYLSSLRNYFSFVNNSNEEDFPLALIISLCVINPMFILILVAHLVLFPEYFLRMQRL